MLKKKEQQSVLILLATLLVGAILGAGLTGAFVRMKLSRLSMLSSPDAFVERMEDVIGPLDDSQADAVRPILHQAGEDVSMLYVDARLEFRDILDEMTRKLEPHLTQEQIERLEERRKMIEWRRARRRLRNERD